MRIYSPTEWDARVNYDLWDDKFYLKDKVAVHWGGDEQPTWTDGLAAEMKIFRGWENWHIDGKGWRGLAYGWGFGASGSILRARGWNNYGAHQGDEDGDSISNNLEVIPFVAIMGENSGPPTDAMWASMQWMYHKLSQDNRGDKAFEVKGHQQITTSGTKCPGPDIMLGMMRISRPMTPTLEERVAVLEAAHKNRDLDRLARRIAENQRRLGAIEDMQKGLANFVAALRAL